jgi:hypothetical protein
MSDSKFIDIYNFQSAAYHRDLQAFFDHTDQKAKTFDWFSRLVQRSPRPSGFMSAQYIGSTKPNLLDLN